MTPKVAIIGKPNVGKSTLFNKLCGRRLAITHDMPGITRDRKEYHAKIGKFHCVLIDTAGLETKKAELSKAMVAQTLAATEEADIILFMVDARYGVNEDDRTFAKQIRKLGKPILLIANKCEGKLVPDFNTLYKLGFGEPISVSAEHNLGFKELEAALVNAFKDIETKAVEVESNQSLKIAILGRPNAGKSTLFNKILGYDRVITSDIPGTTRDAINVTLEHEGRMIEIIDTAGLRKKQKVHENVEELSNAESINALRRAHVVALIVDASRALEKQDLSIAHVAVKEGKGVLLVINKWDLVTEKRAFKEEINYLLEKNLFEIQGVDTVYMSAKHDKDVSKLFKIAAKIEKRWSATISTGKLNSWLKGAAEAHIPPLAKNGRRIRIKYMTQTASRPPTFTLFCNIPEDLPDSYSRYLYNSLRQEFGLEGIPIRLKLKKIDNPYK